MKMLYLIPVGGICNRMRAIDSAINLCKIKRFNLTILWAKNQELNCSFEELFKKNQTENISVHVKEYSGDLIHMYLSKALLYKEIKLGFIKYILYNFKNFFKNKFLDINTSKIFWNLKSNSLITNNEMAIIYNSINVDNDTVDNLDETFIKNIQLKLEVLFNKNKFLIETCYRMHPVKDKLSFFEPVKVLKLKIEKISSRFDNTIGVHIRRTDHIPSKNKSKTSYFISVMRDKLMLDENLNFFLASDDNSVKEELQKEFGNKIITNQIFNYDRNEKSSIESALVDLYCLSKTKLVLGSYLSTFSQTSAIIGGIQCITVTPELKKYD